MFSLVIELFTVNGGSIEIIIIVIINFIYVSKLLAMYRYLANRGDLKYTYINFTRYKWLNKMRNLNLAVSFTAE